MFSSFYQTDPFPPGEVLLGSFGGGVPPASPNPDPISDQKMPFPTPVFRPGFKNPYPFSDLILYVIKHNRQTLAGMIFILSISVSLSPVTRPGCWEEK